MTPPNNEPYIATETLVSTLNAASLPFSNEAEQGLISCLLQDTDRIIEAAVSIPADAFYHFANRTVYSLLVELHQKLVPINIAVLTHTLRERGLLEKIGGASALAELYTFIPITSHYPFFFKVILDKWLLRGQIRACAQSIHEAYQHGAQRDGESVDAILHSAEVRIRGVRDGLARGEFATTAEWMDRVGEDLMTRIERANSVQLQDGPIVIGIPTGIHQLDERTNGIGKGCVWIAKAATSDGKTAFAIQVAVDLVTRPKPVACVYYLTEGNPIDFWFRCVSNYTGLSLHKLTRGDLDPNEQRSAAQALNKIRNSKLILRHKPGITKRELLADMRLTTRNERRDDPKSPIIHVADYLQRIKGRYRGQNEQEHIQDTCAEVTDLTGEMQTGTIILAQVNEEGKTRGSTSPDMDADVSLKISCPPMKDANGKEMVRNDRHGNLVVIRRDEGKRLFTFGKNRMGSRGGNPIILDFNGDTATFR